MSFVYVLACRLFELVVLLVRRDSSKELEILVLRHQLAILRRQTRRPQFTPSDRFLLTALNRVLPRRSWHAMLVTPDVAALASTACRPSLDLPASCARPSANRRGRARAHPAARA